MIQRQSTALLLLLPVVVLSFSRLEHISFLLLSLLIMTILLLSARGNAVQRLPFKLQRRQTRRMLSLWATRAMPIAASSPAYPLSGAIILRARARAFVFVQMAGRCSR